MGELGPARTGRRLAGLPLPSGGLMGVVVLVLIGLLGFSSDDPDLASSRMRLVPGEPGVLTLGFALSPDGRTMATTRSDGRWSLRDVRDIWGIERLSDHRGSTWGVAFSPDGRSLGWEGTSRASSSSTLPPVDPGLA